MDQSNLKSLSQDQRYTGDVMDINIVSYLIEDLFPQNSFQGWVFDIVTHQSFEITIMTLIIANMFTMMVEYHNIKPRLEEILQYINYVFIAIFTGECVMKVIILK